MGCCQFGLKWQSHLTVALWAAQALLKLICHFWHLKNHSCWPSHMLWRAPCFHAFDDNDWNMDDTSVCLSKNNSCFCFVFCHWDIESGHWKQQWCLCNKRNFFLSVTRQLIAPDSVHFNDVDNFQFFLLILHCFVELTILLHVGCCIASNGMTEECVLTPPQKIVPKLNFGRLTVLKQSFF